MRKFLKPLSFLPALCLMYMIYSFSAQDGVTSSQLSYKVSYKIVETGGKVLGADFEPWEIDSIATRFHGVIRKLAHMTEYFALAVAVAFPLYVYGLHGIWLMLVAGMICIAFSCGDEYHQSLVAGRSPSKRDVLIDSFGVFWGIVLVRIIGWTGRKTIFRPLKKKKKKHQQEPPAYSQPPLQGQRPTGSVYPPESVPYTAPEYRGGAGQPYQAASGQPYPAPAAPPYQTTPGESASGQFYRTPARQPYQAAPRQNMTGYTYQAAPHPNASGSVYQTPSGGTYQQPYPPNPYPQQPYQSGPYYGPYPVGYEPEENSRYVSDRLSEDMSFKKLVRDIKDQKKETRKEVRKKPGKPDISGVKLDTIDLDDEE